MTGTTLPPSPGIKSVVLGISRDNRDLESFELHAGKSVIAGSDKNCGIRLEGGQVAPIHALFHLMEESLCVRNWGSQTMVRVNGERIDGQTEIQENDAVSVGEYLIRVVGTREHSRIREAVKASLAATTTPSSGRSEPHSQAAAESAPTSPQTTPPVHPIVASSPEPEPLAPESVESVGPEPASFDPFTPDDSPTPETEFEDDVAADGSSGAWAALTSPAADDLLEQETVELLRLELEQLQRDLAERDARLASLSDSSAPEALAASEVETEKLVERLEQLLDELSGKDERISALEQLLSAAEEVRAAEQEERRQLEAWMRDIEQRMTQRDSERDAELERLHRRLQEATSARSRLQQQLKSLHNGTPIDADVSHQLQQAQQQLADLQQQLEQAEAARQELKQQLDRSGSKTEETVRSEMLEVAQERAEIARQREELARQRSQLAELRQDFDRQETPRRQGHEIDDRIQAFRAHLREVHEKEQQEAAERTLGARLARLWTRLER